MSGHFNFYPEVAFLLLMGLFLHCPAMCGPLIYLIYPHQKQALQFHLGRGLSYTILGGIAGALGQWAYHIPHALLGVLGIVMIFYFLYTLPSARWMKKAKPFPFLLGLTYAFIPCHFLWTIVGIAALTGKASTGALLLFIHAVLSTFSVQSFKKIFLAVPQLQKIPKLDVWLLALSTLTLLFRVFFAPDKILELAHSALNCF